MESVQLILLDGTPLRSPRVALGVCRLQVE